MVKLFSKNSNICDHNSPTSQTDRQTDDMRSQYRALHESASRGKNEWILHSLHACRINYRRMSTKFTTREPRTHLTVIVMIVWGAIGLLQTVQKLHLKPARLIELFGLVMQLLWHRLNLPKFCVLTCCLFSDSLIRCVVKCKSWLDGRTYYAMAPA